MKWLFWWNECQKDSNRELKMLADQLGRIGDKISAVSEAVGANSEQIETLAGQMAKLVRVQYKSGQEVQANLNNFRKEMADHRHWQSEYTQEKADNSLLLQQRDVLVQALLMQLDEMDAVCSNLQSDDSEWLSLLQAWTKRVIGTLAELEFYELDVAGKSFNPHNSEAVGAISRVSVSCGIPYEVAYVMRRGFINGVGEVLRKAQVITYKENQDD